MCFTASWGAPSRASCAVKGAGSSTNTASATSTPWAARTSPTSATRTARSRMPWRNRRGSSAISPPPPSRTRRWRSSLPSSPRPSPATSTSCISSRAAPRRWKPRSSWRGSTGWSAAGLRNTRSSRSLPPITATRCSRSPRRRASTTRQCSGSGWWTCIASPRRIPTAARVAAATRAAVGIRRGDAMHVHKPLPEHCLVVLARRRGEREQRVAVIGGSERDDLVFLRPAALHPVLPRQLERGFHRLGAAREEIQLVEVAGEGRGELGSELLHRRVREGGGGEIAELPRLLRHGIRDLAVRVAEVGDVRAAHGVEVALAVFVDEPAPFTAHDAREGAPQLAVKHMALGIPVRRHPLPFLIISPAESYDPGPRSASLATQCAQP